MGKVRLVFPRAEDYRKHTQKSGGRVLTDLEHKVVAFIDDGRPNAGVALESVRQEMENAFHIHPVLINQKAFGLGPPDPLPAEVFQRLINEVDAVVVGIAS